MKAAFKTVLEYLHYYKSSGRLIWIKTACRSVKVGARAGSNSRDGYRCIGIAGKKYLEHRVIWRLQTGAWPKQEIDHKDGNRSNNKWKNLRLATTSQNHANSKKRASNTSGFKGAYWHKGKKRWRAQIKSGGKIIGLGHYLTPELAHAAYVKAAKKHFGNFARAA